MKKWQLLFIGTIVILFVFVVVYFTANKGVNNTAKKQKDEIQFERIGGLYDEIKLLNYIEEDYIFVARKNNEEFIVRNGTKISNSFDEIPDLEVYGSNYAFVTGKPNQWFVHFKDKNFGPYEERPDLVVPSEQPERLNFVLSIFNRNRWLDPEYVISDGIKKMPYLSADENKYHSSNYRLTQINGLESVKKFGDPQTNHIFEINGKTIKVFVKWANGLGIEYDEKDVFVLDPIRGDFNVTMNAADGVTIPEEKVYVYQGFGGIYEINDRILFMVSFDRFDREMGKNEYKIEWGVYAEHESN